MFMFVLKGRRSKFFRVTIFVLITVVFAVGGTARDVCAASAAKASIAEAAATDVSGRDNKDKIISSEDALLSSVGSMLENAGAPASTKPKLPKAGLTADFTWDAPQILKGIYSSADLYFSLPKYWSTKYVCVKLEYRVSQLIKDIPCTLTFAINKQPFYSCQLTYKNNEKNFIYVLIPANLIKNDRESSTNTLTISGYARLYNDQGCIDDESNANWITFSEASGVEVGYDLLAHQNRIDFYPYPFISSDNQSGADTVVTVADTAQNEEVAAAMMIMTGLGKNTKNNNNLEISSWKEAQSGGKSRHILVGLTKDMPAGLTKYIQPYRNQLKGQVMLLFVNDDRGNPLLLITSEDADCLAEAGYFLGDSERVSQESDNITFIRKGTAEIRKNARAQSDMKADRYNLQEMTGGGFEFIGPFRQEKTLFLPLPADYILSSASKVTVNFRYSKNLDFNRSMLTVYWGDIPVGSKKLALENADNDELTFFMPADVVGTKGSSMKFAFDLEIPDLFCTTRRDEMPWAYITKNTSIYLPPDNSTRLSFDSRPAPFQKGGSLNDVLLVLSDKPTAAELTLLGRTLSLYSAAADAYGSLTVKKAGEFNEQEANYNIITSGTPAGNSLISKINDKLYFKYNSSGSEFMTNDKLILTSDYARSIGTLQLLKSPYADGRALLVLTGPDPNALGRVTKLVSNEKMSWNLKNDFVLIDSKGNIKSYQFQNEELTETKPTLAKSIFENRSSLLFALAGTSVMVVLFLAMLLIILRMRHKRPNP